MFRAICVVVSVLVCGFVCNSETVEDRIQVLEKMFQIQQAENLQLKHRVAQLEETSEKKHEDLKRRISDLEAEKKSLHESLLSLQETISYMSSRVSAIETAAQSSKAPIIHSSSVIGSDLKPSKASSNESYVSASRLPLGPSDSTHPSHEEAGSSSKSPSAKHIFTDTLNDITLKAYKNKRAVGSEVAFHAYLSGTRCYSHHEVFVFDVEMVDIGNSYSATDGLFDAPVTGVYLFSWTVAAMNSHFFTAELIVNGAIRGAITSDSDGGVQGGGNGVHPATAVVLTNVNAGEHVFIRFQKGGGCTVESDARTRSSFSGWLLM